MGERVARPRVGKFGSLNVVAHPHPPGTYRKLFEAAGEKDDGVRIRGVVYAGLGKPTRPRGDIFSGVIAFWTEIPEDSQVITKRTKEEQRLAESGLNLPSGVGFNSRVFAFSFNESKHTIFIQTKNDDGESVSIATLQKAFSAILNDVLPPEIEELDVHIRARKDALDEIERIDVIRSLRIVVSLPNPDGIDDRFERKIRELKEANVQKQEIRATKARGSEGIKLVGDLRTSAELAIENGFVEASGMNGGVAVKKSTQSFPEEISVVLEGDETSASITRRLAAE